MKVTTDTILLGAWARMSDTSSNKERWGLDIGTGTGTISLMLLQRDSCLRMHAVELDGPSAEQAQENAANSPWGDRMEVMSCSIQVLIYLSVFTHEVFSGAEVAYVLPGMGGPYYYKP
eukprot:1497831-Rhodomonas_salina.2